MILKPCPFCEKEIPRSIQVCPYCHRDEKGATVQLDPLENLQEKEANIQRDLEPLISEDPVRSQEASLRLVSYGSLAVPALISLMKDHKGENVSPVAVTLGRIKDRRAIASLVYAARLGDENLRISAIWALSQFREPEALTALQNAAEMAHPVIQPFAAYMLGEFHDEGAAAMLCGFVGSKQRETAFHSVWALSETPGARAISGLRKAAQSTDSLVKNLAHTALRLKGVSMLPSGFRGWKLWVIFVLGVVLGVSVFYFYK